MSITDKPSRARKAPAPFQEHDHAECADDAMTRAEAVCAARGARLTPIRRRVLEILWETHQPVGAYAILERLRKDGAAAQPPAVYRALDFLMAHGLAHRIASASAFIGCAHAPSSPSEAPCEAHFVICRRCGVAAELTGAELRGSLERAAAAIGFAAETITLEIEGVCEKCAASAS